MEFKGLFLTIFTACLLNRLSGVGAGFSQYRIYSGRRTGIDIGAIFS